MSSAGVRQLTVLAELFKSTLDRCRESVALLGVASGNGLDQIDCKAQKGSSEWISISGISMRSSDGSAHSPELHCRDVAERGFGLAPVMLVHAGLIFEHVGLASRWRMHFHSSPEQENRSLPAGKTLWLGIFSQGSHACACSTEPDLT